MKEISDFLINMVEKNTIPGPYTYGSFTDTMLYIVKKAGNTYQPFYSYENGKLVSIRPFSLQMNAVLFAFHPYLNEDKKKDAFIKAESEYLFEKLKPRIGEKAYQTLKTMLDAYPIKEEQKEEYEHFCSLFRQLK